MTEAKGKIPQLMAESGFELKAHTAGRWGGGAYAVATTLDCLPGNDSL